MLRCGQFRDAECQRGQLLEQAPEEKPASGGHHACLTSLFLYEPEAGQLGDGVAAQGVEDVRDLHDEARESLPACKNPERIPILLLALGGQLYQCPGHQ